MKHSPVVISLEGRVDSGNASKVENQIQTKMMGKDDIPVEIDAQKLEYISSAGLRVLLRLKQKHPDLSITGVNSTVYEILEMTGFTEMMHVEKAYRMVSVDGCEEIGRGANGTIYRIDQDTVVKVYNNADSLAEIQHEREMAKLALILGIPTAISYDVVKVGNSYGSVFELLNARSFTKILIDEPEKLDWCVDEFVHLLKKIHSTVVPKGKLRDIKETVLYWVSTMESCLPSEAAEKLESLVQAVPYDNHLVHGDYHTKNIELQNDEVLLIDMDTLAVGNPVFELASVYNSLIGFSEWDHEHIRRFQGYDFETAKTFWAKTLTAYLETDDEAALRNAEEKIRIVSYTRLLSRSIRHREYETETGKLECRLWKSELLQLLEKVDTLLF